MDMERKHCRESKKQSEKKRERGEKRECKMQQHLVIARERKSEILSEKGVGQRRRRRRRRRRKRKRIKEREEIANTRKMGLASLRYYFM